MKKSDMIEILEKEIKYCQFFVEEMKDEKNPQIKLMVLEHNAKIEAYESVLYYVRTGSKIYFSAR